MDSKKVLGVEYVALNQNNSNEMALDLPVKRCGKIERIKSKAKSYFTKETAKRRLPCLVWMQVYSVEHLVGDLVAGLTVGLMIIPQALAYAAIAGLPANYGLNTAIFSSFLYVFFGTTKELNIGPTAIISLMTYQYSSNGGADYAVLLCFISGIIEIIAGFINLGFLINFISQPVISGFTSAAAITIASSQLKSLFGLKLKTRGLIDTWVKVVQNLPNFKWQDLTLGIVCIVVLSLMKPLRTVKFRCLDPESRSLGQRILKQVLFFLSVGRNAIVVIIASFIAYELEGENQPFTLTGFVQPGIPSPSLPPFSTVINNQTMSFGDIMSDVGIGLAMVPFIGVLDLIAVASAFTKGRTFDANQEIIALGIATFVGSFFGSMPITGCLSRSAVQATSGVRTPAAGLVVGVIVLLALGLLTPAFYFIPKATLAAVIICAVLHMIDYEVVMPIWRSKRIDLLPMAVTFVACIGWGLEWGILLGIGVNLAMLLYATATPNVSVSCWDSKEKSTKYLVVTPKRGINYPGISHLRRAVRKASKRQGMDSLPIIINCTYIEAIDYTSAKGVKSMIDDFKVLGLEIIFLNLKPKLKATVMAITKDVNFCSSFDEIDMIKDANPERNNSVKKSTTITFKDKDEDDENGETNSAPLAKSEDC